MYKNGSSTWTDLGCSNGYNNIKPVSYLKQRMPVHDNVSWNTIIGGYAEQWHGNNEGLCLFNAMKKSGTNPDGFTFVRILGMCVSLMALNHVHAHVIKSGYGSNTYVSNVLIDLYGKHGDVEASCQVFNRMLTRDVVSWSSMLGVYSLHGFYEKALTLYGHLKNEGVEPDDVTFINILNVCASLQALKIGYQHEMLVYGM